MRRNLMIAILFLVAHFAVSLTVLLRAAGNGLAFSETLPPAPRSQFVEMSAAIVTFPVLLVPSGIAPNMAWWIPFLLNSLLWTATLYGAFHYSRKLFGQTRSSLPNTR